MTQVSQEMTKWDMPDILPKGSDRVGEHVADVAVQLTTDEPRGLPIDRRSRRDGFERHVPQRVGQLNARRSINTTHLEEVFRGPRSEIHTVLEQIERDPVCRQQPLESLETSANRPSMRR